MKHKNLMAKALYDNVPESPEELSFRKGDILTVIEQNTGGLEGWWLCSLHGRQGIAPGNRLKLLIGPMFESQSPLSSAAQSPLQNVVSPTAVGFEQNTLMSPPYQGVTATRTGNSSNSSSVTQPPQGIYDVPTAMKQQGIYDVPQGNHAGKSCQAVYDVPPLLRSDSRRQQGVYDVPLSSQGLYSVPSCRSDPVAEEESSYDFPQPHKRKQETIYDAPPPSSHCKATQFPPLSTILPDAGTASHHRYRGGPDDNSIYDVPPGGQLSSVGAERRRDLYDIPCDVQSPPQNRLASSTERERRVGHLAIYDQVPSRDTPPRLPGDVTDNMSRLSFSSVGSSVRGSSSMSSSSSSAAGSPPEPRLALDLDSAVQRLGQLRLAVESSSAALVELVSSAHWRTTTTTLPFMERHAKEVQTALETVRGALHDLLLFGRGAMGNAAVLPDPTLYGKLRRQLLKVEDSQLLLQQQAQQHQDLDMCRWTSQQHVHSGGGSSSSSKHQGKNDDLDRFVIVSRTAADDARQLASTIGGSAELLFTRSSAVGEGALCKGTREECVGVIHPLRHNHTDYNCNNEMRRPFPVAAEKADMNNSEKCIKSWMEDYDYVHLQGKEEFEQHQRQLLDKENITKQKVQLEQEQLDKLRRLEEEVIRPVENDVTRWIANHHHSAGSSSARSDSSSSSSAGGGADRQLLGFYADQCEQHFDTLLSAIDAFFSCVAAGQPPRIFVAHSKFVILSAHKLVFVGDSLSRQASALDVANRIMNSSNALCDLLKTVVAATKRAALIYPNTLAVQEMVDRVAQLSHEGQRFKTQLHQMAAM